MASEITLGELAVRVRRLPGRIEHGIGKGLLGATTRLLKAVHEMFGEYQEGAGPFPTWAELAPSTVTRKSEPSGYPSFGTFPSPLVRTGALRDSYQMQVDGMEASVGSDSEYALIHETGGWAGPRYIPQRATLGLAFARNEKRLFQRFNADAWYEIEDAFGMRSVLHSGSEALEDSESMGSDEFMFGDEE